MLFSPRFKDVLIRSSLLDLSCLTHFLWTVPPKRHHTEQVSVSCHLLQSRYYKNHVTTCGHSLISKLHWRYCNSTEGVRATPASVIILSSVNVLHRLMFPAHHTGQCPCMQRNKTRAYCIFWRQLITVLLLLCFYFSGSFVQYEAGNDTCTDTIAARVLLECCKQLDDTSLLSLLQRFYGPSLSFTTSGTLSRWGLGSVRSDSHPFSALATLCKNEWRGQSA